MGFTGVISPYYLVGGFKYCLFSPRMFGEMIQFDGCIFFRWVVQPSPRNSLAFVACPVLLFFCFSFRAEVQRAEYIFFFGGVKFHMRFCFFSKCMVSANNQNGWFHANNSWVGGLDEFLDTNSFYFLGGKWDPNHGMNGCYRRLVISPEIWLATCEMSPNSGSTSLFTV